MNFKNNGVMLPLATVLIFAASCIIGLHLSRQNPIDNDESYTQHTAIEKLSVPRILAGEVEEGNNFPLFYILQKLALESRGFQLKEPHQTEQNICNIPEQNAMRLLPVLFMSLAISLLFYYFARYHHPWMGIAALALTLTSPMIWQFWAQARPYGLWILLTVIQLFALARIHQQNIKSSCLLHISHVLLCLTCPFGLIQTAIACIILRRCNILIYSPLFCLGIFYIIQAPHYPFRVPHPPAQLILENIPIDRLMVIMIGSLLLFRQHAALFLQTASLLLIPAAVIWYYCAINVQGNTGFELSARYFIHLTPISVFISLYAWAMLWKKYSGHFWNRIYLIELMGAMVLLGLLRTSTAIYRLWG